MVTELVSLINTSCRHKNFMQTPIYPTCKWFNSGSQLMNTYIFSIQQLSIRVVFKRGENAILGHNYRLNFILCTHFTLTRIRFYPHYEHLSQFKDNMQMVLKKQSCQIEGSLIIWTRVMPIDDHMDRWTMT